jgi:uncharacterized protein with PIN domain
LSNSASRKQAAVLRYDQIRAKAPAIERSAEPPRFVADVMVGRLAKWLRIAGFDVSYSNRITDDEVVALSRSQDRIILSRDTRLLVRRAVRDFIFLESDDIRSQIRQVFAATRTTSLPGLLSRCLDCNETLEIVPREKVRESVPPFVFATQPKFKSCPRCRKVYWAGTHRLAVLRTLETLFAQPDRAPDGNDDPHSR